MAIPYQAIINQTLYRGDDWNRKITISNESDPSFDFSGTTVICQIRETEEGVDKILELIPTPDTSNLGEISINLDFAGAITKNVSPGDYVYDVEFTLPDGRVRTFVKGMISVIADVTRT
jgi:hypothetical protein